MARQLARRRRRERAAGAAIAALGVVVLVVAIFALRHPRGQGTLAGSDTRAPSSSAPKPARSSSSAPTQHISSSTSATRASSSPASSATAAAAKLPLVVLNDTTIAGLAKQAAATFQSGGWTVTQVGNLQNDILSTCAYYDPSAKGARASAELLRRQFPVIKRVVAKFAELPAGPIVVVLTPDYPSG